MHQQTMKIYKYVCISGGFLSGFEQEKSGVSAAHAPGRNPNQTVEHPFTVELLRNGASRQNEAGLPA